MLKKSQYEVFPSLSSPTQALYITYSGLCGARTCIFYCNMVDNLRWGRGLPVDPDIYFMTTFASSAKLLPVSYRSHKLVALSRRTNANCVLPGGNTYISRGFRGRVGGWVGG